MERHTKKERVGGHMEEHTKLQILPTINEDSSTGTSPYKTTRKDIWRDIGRNTYEMSRGGVHMECHKEKHTRKGSNWEI